MSRPKKGEAGHEAAKRKFRETLLRKYGSEEAVREHFRKIGAKGGHNGTTGGFYDRELAKRAGAIGGHRSLVGYKIISDEDGEVTYQNKKTGELLVRHLND